MTIELGIYYDLISEQYFGVDAINCSQIKAAVKRSVFHMKMGKGHTMVQATADQGSTVHAGMLEPDKDMVDCIDVPARRGRCVESAL